MYKELFNHLSKEHNLILLESEMQEIISIIEKSQNKYTAIGKTVVVERELYGHEFKIGEEVEIINYNPEALFDVNFKCQNRKGYIWWLSDKEFRFKD